MKMKKLIFKKEYGPDILDGKKVSTVRLFTKIKKGEIVEIIAGRIKIGTARVENVETKKVEDLTDDDARLDGFRNKEELVKALRKIYGKRINSETEVKLIKFKLVGSNES
jgi:hypothetical protein